ncbi:MAG: sulfur carrier protein ThiS [Lawsonibacter sp.]|mgnify:FL=1|jgi:sulfur carrier protein|nr:sulfur carrier protein ThiS [Lawsonibacter sp.]
MMQLNHRDYKDWQEGLTVQALIEACRFTWPKLVVKLNGRVVWPEEYGATILKDTDDLEVIHLLGGG